MVPLAHSVERELARVFDEVGIPWEHEPTTFVLERNPDGTTALRQKLTARKLREQGVVVAVLYRRDFERLRERHGFPFDFAA